MPIYEYKCEACGDLFERLARNSEDHPAACPTCHEPNPRKQFSSFAPGVGSSNTESPCPSAAECPSGTCCAGGGCPM